MSMALFKLRRIEEAQTAFQRLESVMSDPEEVWSYSEIARALFEECQALLNGSDGQPEQLRNNEPGR